MRYTLFTLWLIIMIPFITIGVLVINIEAAYTMGKEFGLTMMRKYI